jgi:ABC-type amino acid transport substrate-binding protein
MHRHWFKSSFSGEAGQCVYVRESLYDTVLVTHSKGDQAAVEFTREEWDAFIKGVKNGEFDVSP